LLKKTLTSIIQNKQLVWEMAKRDLKGTNAGSILGILWLVLNPLLQTTVYVVIVSVVFRTRLGQSNGLFDYALYVLSGMIPWQIMMKSLQESPSIIRDRIDLVKQVIYPIETLPMTSIIVGSFGALINLLILMLLYSATLNIKWSIIFIPIPFILLVLFLLGIAWIFSIAGVLLKDLREIVNVLLNLMVYISPVLIVQDMVSPKIWTYILYNPLAHIIICFRDVFQTTFHPVSWACFVSLTFISFLLGAWVITRAKILINEYI